MLNIRITFQEPPSCCVGSQAEASSQLGGLLVASAGDSHGAQTQSYTAGVRAVALIMFEMRVRLGYEGKKIRMIARCRI